MKNIILISLLSSCTGCSHKVQLKNPWPNIGEFMPVHSSTMETPEIPASTDTLVLSLDGEVNHGLVDPMIDEIHEKAPKNIVLYIDSPGGSVGAGFDFSKALENSGAHTKCIVDGDADSMAMFILQSCDERLMTKRSVLMIHEISITYQASGHPTEWANIVNYMKVKNRALVEHIAKRMKISADELEKMTAGGAEVWLNWNKATELGAIDGTI